MDEKFTPRPWHISGEYDQGSIIANVDIDEMGSESYDLICEVNEYGPWQANARLIAAAPEMYAALRKLVSQYHIALVGGGAQLDAAATACQPFLDVLSKAEGK